MFYKFCFVPFSQEDGKMKFVEHKELYVSSTDPDQDMLCPHRDQTIMALLADPDKMCARGSGAIVDSLKSAQVCYLQCNVRSGFSPKE